MAALGHLLDISGIGSNRLWLRWVSSAEGKLFADYAGEISEAAEALGPLDRTALHLPLAAVKRTLNSSRVRWLVGMERELVEHQNVYGDKIDPERYTDLVYDALQQEYDKALVLEALSEKEGQKVAQISDKTRLAKHIVASSLLEMERAGEVELDSYDDRDPRFVRAVA